MFLFRTPGRTLRALSLAGFAAGIAGCGDTDPLPPILAGSLLERPAVFAIERTDHGTTFEPPEQPVRARGRCFDRGGRRTPDFSRVSVACDGSTDRPRRRTKTGRTRPRLEAAWPAPGFEQARARHRHAPRRPVTRERTIVSIVPCPGPWG